jgi:hypothetical protein
MTMPRRAVLLALLALAVPLPALALTGGEDDAAPVAIVDLSVSASLDGCGTSASTIVCKIDASWNGVPGAERYTASVTRADGSVADYGDVGAGSASFWVPYVGNGTYSVQVSAYGTPPGSDEPEVIAKGTSGTDTGAGADAFGGGPPGGQTFSQDPTDAGQPGGTGEVEDPDQTPPGTDPEEPVCEEPVEPPEEPPVSEPPADPGDASAAALDPAAADVPDESAETPDSVQCPDPALEG